MKPPADSRMDTPTPGFFRPLAAAAYLGVSRATLYRMVQAGVLSPPVRLFPGVTGWPLATLDQVIEHAASQGKASCNEDSA
ncbi:MAG: helix-turn-helix transcriptional regulator [Acidiferrobacterales bacterium]